jgi:transcriptional regulator with XRE-family HTH domain
VEFAKRIKETQSYVGKVERGERRLDLVQLQVFCKAKGISLSRLEDVFEKVAAKG